MDGRRKSQFAPEVDKYDLEKYGSTKRSGRSEVRLTNLAKSGSESLKHISRHSKNLYQLKDMDATKDMDKILKSTKPISSRA